MSSSSTEKHYQCPLCSTDAMHLIGMKGIQGHLRKRHGVQLKASEFAKLDGSDWAKIGRHPKVSAYTRYLTSKARTGKYSHARKGLEPPSTLVADDIAYLLKRK